MAGGAAGRQRRQQSSSAWPRGPTSSAAASVEEAGAGGRAARARQALLALLPLKAARGERVGRGSGVGWCRVPGKRSGMGALGSRLAAIAPNRWQHLRPLLLPPLLLLPPPASPVVVGELLPRLQVVAGKENQPLAPVHVEHLGVKRGLARVVLRGVGAGLVGSRARAVEGPAASGQMAAGDHTGVGRRQHPRQRSGSQAVSTAAAQARQRGGRAGRRTVKRVMAPEQVESSTCASSRLNR